jgi:hypothetical protein
MTNQYLNKQTMLNVLDAHLTDLNAEQYSHRLRIMEFDAAGIENINGGMYEEISNMINQYDNRIAALQAERDRVSLLDQ